MITRREEYISSVIILSTTRKMSLFFFLLHFYFQYDIKRNKISLKCIEIYRDYKVNKLNSI